MSNTIKGVTCKNGYYYARIDGKQKYCGKGEKGFNMAKTARMKWEVKQYENREINVGLKVKKVQLKNVTDLSNWYMILPSIQEQKSYIRKVHASKRLLDFFGNKPLNQIEGVEQERYREHRSGQGAASGTIDLELKTLRSMYIKAIKGKLIPVNFKPGEFILKREVVPRRIITKDEFGLLLERAKPDFKDVLICGYETAMRSKEICNLTAGQVHLDIRHISGAVLDYIDLGIFDTKTGARRTVPVGARLKEVLQRRIKNLGSDDYVFTTKSGIKFIPDTIRQRMIAVCKKAKIIYGDKALNGKGERIGIVFHCLRHSRTTLWVKAGFSDEIIRRATGHRSLEAYQQYIKLDPHAVMRLVENPKQDKNGTKLAQSL
jgi:integrase